ncbi:MAG: hypothetical protein D4R45_07410 [Planctomycetaceae bacterium]|nr:MAG: hypothetical protein D4R45_07410 [Planctomycetaceae bacterium]
MLARKAFLILSTKMITAVCSFVGFYFVAHYMGAEKLGIFAAAIGFVGTLSFFTDPGLHDTHLKKINAGKDLGSCTGTFLLIKGVVILLMILLVSIGLYVSQYASDNNFNNPVFVITVCVVLVGAVAGQITAVFTTTFSALLLTARQELPNFVGLISIPLRIVVAIRQMSAVALATATTIGSLLSLGASLFLARDLPFKKPSRPFIKDYFTFMTPLALGSFIGTIAKHADKVILNYFNGPIQVGYLFVAQRIVTFIDFHSVAVSKVTFPVLSKLFHQDNLTDFNALINKSQKHILIFLAVIGTIVIVFRKEIIGIIAGGEFVDSADILAVLYLLTVVAALSRPMNYALIAIGQNKFYAKISIMVNVITLICYFLFIPHSLGGISLFGFEAIGAAFSMLIANTIAMASLVIFLYLKIGYYPNRQLLAIIVVTFVTSGVLIFVKSLLGSNWYVLPFCVFVGCGFFLASGYIAGFITREELILYRNIINPNEMKNYIVSEIASIGERKGA